MAIRTKLYLIAAPGTGRFKIGQARDVHVRFQSLNGGSPVPLKLIHAIQVRNSDAFRLEFRLHHILRQYHARGEWFKLPKKLATAKAFKLLVADARQWLDDNPNAKTCAMAGAVTPEGRLAMAKAKSKRIAADMRMRATYLPNVSIKSRFCDMGRSGFDLAPCV